VFVLKGEEGALDLFPNLLLEDLDDYFVGFVVVTCPEIPPAVWAWAV